MISSIQPSPLLPIYFVLVGYRHEGCIGPFCKFVSRGDTFLVEPGEDDVEDRPELCRYVVFGLHLVVLEELRPDLVPHNSSQTLQCCLQVVAPRQEGLELYWNQPLSFPRR